MVIAQLLSPTIICAIANSNIDNAKNVHIQFLHQHHFVANLTICGPTPTLILNYFSVGLAISDQAKISAVCQLGYYYFFMSSHDKSCDI
jgi:hypothetical protein